MGNCQQRQFSDRLKLVQHVGIEHSKSLDMLAAVEKALAPFGKVEAKMFR